MLKQIASYIYEEHQSTMDWYDRITLRLVIAAHKSTRVLSLDLDRASL
jgi:hypothetical protein